MDLPHNLGIGGAVQTGYKFAIERRYRLIARIDGDGQHDATLLPTLMAPVLAGEADVVIGSRFVGDADDVEERYHASPTRSGGILFYARLVSLIIGQRVTDTTSGFQVCNADVAAFFSREFPCDYPEVEMVAALGRAGYRIHEVPVYMRKRAAGSSSITPMRSAYYAIKVTLALLVGLLRRPARRVGSGAGTSMAPATVESGVA
jgi:glycosyltransferase involved in cell wall biosynthesis